MKRFINNLSIRKKFVILYLLGVLLPIMLLVGYVLTIVTDQIRGRERLNAAQSLDRIYSTLNTHLSQTIMLGNAVSTDSQLLSLLGADYASPTAYYDAYYNTIRPICNRYVFAYISQITGLEIYTSNPTTAAGGRCLHLDSVKDTEMYSQLPENGSARLVSYVAKQFTSAPAMQLSILRELKNDSPYQHVLKIDLNMAAINRAVEQESAYLSVYLVGPDNLAVSYPGSTRVGSVDQRIEMGAIRADLSASFGDSTAMSGWRLDAVLNKAPAEHSVREAVWVGILVGLVFSLFAGFLSLLFARSIDVRSQRLLRHMDSMTAEHFEPITRELGTDEIGELTAHFNAMGERLKQVIHDLYVLQLQQKTLELEHVRAELKYLQAQIDPHFLFNTLNAILVLCVRNGYTELAEIIRALSKLLRRMVDTTRTMVSLREELEFVRMVLTIERFRFGDKLRYELDVGEDAMDCQVPVMCVQGLVENACKHGVQNLDGQGVVRVRATREDGALRIEVRDNGVGIEPKRLAELGRQIESPEDMPGSIGLQNIYRRLRLHYGAEANLTLANAEGQGTVAVIRVPLGEE